MLLSYRIAEGDYSIMKLLCLKKRQSRLAATMVASGPAGKSTDVLMMTHCTTILAYMIQGMCTFGTFVIASNRQAISKL